MPELIERSESALTVGITELQFWSPEEWFLASAQTVLGGEHGQRVEFQTLLISGHGLSPALLPFMVVPEHRYWVLM